MTVMTPRAARSLKNTPPEKEKGENAESDHRCAPNKDHAVATYRVLIIEPPVDGGPAPESRLVEADDRRDACDKVRANLPDNLRTARLRAVFVH